MRNRLFVLTFVSISVLVCSFVDSAQAQAGAGTRTRRFDPRDHSGYWMRTGPRETDHPPLTPRGEQMTKGRRPDHLFDNPADVNDPMYKCNPQGFPRLTWEENEPFEIVHLPNRVMHFYQWDRTLRELWMDGRALPSGENIENIGPNWYGHSVARWEGNTLVVETTGFDERMWVDVFGNPISLDARAVERFTRTGPDTIEGRMTLYDPKNYTAPWEYPVMQFRRMRDQDVTFFGWKGIFSGVTDAICAPMNEIDDFNKRLLYPAVGVTPP